jgi:cytidylate kinase
VLIAIDGPAASGKSTVARGVAARLGYRYLDSGAMYRCVALLWLQHPDREPAAVARSASIELDGERVSCDGSDVSAQIRAPEVAEAASRLAADAAVREALVRKQRALLAGGDWVVEGRDIGSVVAPEAQLKLFITASEQERARRRAAQLGVEESAVRAQLGVRDARDSTRAHSPLAPAEDAVVLETTELDPDEVIERVLELARVRLAAG